MFVPGGIELKCFHQYVVQKVCSNIKQATSFDQVQQS